MSSEAALGQRSTRATDTGTGTRLRLAVPAVRALSARSRPTGDGYIPLIVLFSGLIIAVDLLAAGLTTRLVAAKSNLVGVFVFITVFTVLALVAFWVGGRMVRKLPR